MCISSIQQLNENSIEFSLLTWTRSETKLSRLHSYTFTGTIHHKALPLLILLSSLVSDVTVVLWTSSHILYGLPLHQKGNISKATCWWGSSYLYSSLNRYFVVPLCHYLVVTFLWQRYYIDTSIVQSEWLISLAILHLLGHKIFT